MQEYKRVFEKIFENSGSDIAIVDSSNRTLTYDELRTSCISLAMKLETLESNKKQRNFLLFIGNEIEYAIGLIAIWLVDGTAILVEAKTRDQEIYRLSEMHDCDTIVCSSDSGAYDFPILHKVIAQIDHRGCNYSLDVMEYKNEVAMIFQTSGTTQKSKYVKISHEGIIEECNALAKAHGFSRGARELLVVPITSSFGTCGVLLPNLFAGGSVSIVQGELNTLKLIRVVKETKVTIVACTSSILSLMVKTLENRDEDFPFVDYIISAGETSNVSLLERAKELFGAKNVVQAYGLTETSSEVAGSCLDLNAPLCSVGRVLDNFQVRIKREDGSGEKDPVGEILVKGKSVTLGYCNHEELNCEAFEGDWFKTGDIGYIDEDGYLFIKGRIKNTIIVGGKNVFPEEVETILMKNKKVLFAYVFSKASSITGEQVIARIVKKEGEKINEEEILRYCRDNMKSYMIPKKIIFDSERKINTSGKASRE